MSAAWDQAGDLIVAVSKKPEKTYQDKGRDLSMKAAACGPARKPHWQRIIDLWAVSGNFKRGRRPVYLQEARLRPVTRGLRYISIDRKIHEKVHHHRRAGRRQGGDSASTGARWLQCGGGGSDGHHRRRSGPRHGPNTFDFVRRAKFDTWSAIKGMTMEDSMQQYIDLVNSLRGEKEVGI